MISPEVLIYIQTIKNYISNNEETKEYFIGNNDAEIFYEKLLKKSENNFTEKGDPKLSKEDFEELKKSFTNKTKEKTDQMDNVFQNISTFGKICLN
jgi:hypothetical protein